MAGVNFAGAKKAVSVLSLFSPAYLAQGLAFSVPLMLILLTHEMGHYLASVHHRVKATLPYFIPAPTLIGTFGAFIKMKSPIYHKRALLDIGASGPLAGFIVSIPALIIGLKLSKIVPVTRVHGISLGSSIMMELMTKLFAPTTPPGFELVIHPIGFAGWIGLFVTSLNLIPIGQLDGGHVAYALFGEKSAQMANKLLFIMAVMGILFWQGWLFWAGIIFFLGKKHPPSINQYVELDTSRKVLAFIVLAIFILTFIPQPFVLNM
jgi:membrane-associated protease RseP (regulator of RpoE activity)